MIHTDMHDVVAEKSNSGQNYYKSAHWIWKHPKYKVSLNVVDSPLNPLEEASMQKKMTAGTTEEQQPKMPSLSEGGSV